MTGPGLSRDRLPVKKSSILFGSWHLLWECSGDGGETYMTDGNRSSSLISRGGKFGKAAFLVENHSYI